jgi:hypothetical protein
MGTILCIKWTLVQQPEVGFVDQSCTLQGVPRTLSLQVVTRNVAEFLVNEWNQSFKRLLVARLPAYEQLAHRVGMLLIHGWLQPQMVT